MLFLTTSKNPTSWLLAQIVIITIIWSLSCGVTAQITISSSLCCIRKAARRHIFSCFFVLGLNFICVYYPISFLRILKNKFFSHTWNTGKKKIRRLTLREVKLTLINIPITSHLQAYCFISFHMLPKEVFFFFSFNKYINGHWLWEEEPSSMLLNWERTRRKILSIVAHVSGTPCCGVSNTF